VESNNAKIALSLVSLSGDWTKNTPEVEFPYIRDIDRLFGDKANVGNAHFPKE
jgi:hypothetical protein